jgi:PPK2 family polyphosphate:nucleotide phosphotransferase
VTELLEGLRIEPGHDAHLGTRDAADKRGLRDRDHAKDIVATDVAQLRELQGRLWAESRRSVLLVLQGMDAAGKDGTIRHVFSGVNPQGCRVVSFKAPTAVEAAHDFLWRIHQVVPAHGEIGIFNRSHYEDVVAARVLGIVDDDTCRRRYDHITAFERQLRDAGTAVVKVLLHVSRNEQRDRLQARLDEPHKRWKFNPDDLDARKQWDEYQRLYDAAISATSTEHAPWWIVPADYKWVRDVVVSRLLVDTLTRMDPKYPDAPPGLDNLVIE